MPHPVTRPASVWDTGRHDLRHQLAHRHVTATRAGSALTPAVARRIITTYTAPGDTVCDPQPGPGLVLAEAIRAGRHALGVKPGPDWVSALEGNLDHARLAGPVGTVHLLNTLDDPHTDGIPTPIDLLVTGVHPAAQRLADAMIQLTDALGPIARWVRPGGFVVLASRPWRHEHTLLDMPRLLCRTATTIGFTPVEHCVALTAPMRDNQIRPRSRTRSGQRTEHRDPHGRPTAQPTHLDVLVFRAAPTAANPTPRDEPVTAPLHHNDDVTPHNSESLESPKRPSRRLSNGESAR
ncbi:TRM11 family methyltransferase [Allosaccharopolyspora coralli]|uniref:DNA modification methylase n=1 Tax=Allosaccharopolyspora coralli TaxID=2665642 RepID=UPI001651DDBE|nr:DNA modification methylase [Allosaccharopolyspora coralli]